MFLFLFAVFNLCSNVDCQNGGQCQPQFVGGEICPRPMCQCTGCWTNNDCSVCKFDFDFFTLEVFCCCKFFLWLVAKQGWVHPRPTCQHTRCWNGNDCAVCKVFPLLNLEFMALRYKEAKWFLKLWRGFCNKPEPPIP